MAQLSFLTYLRGIYKINLNKSGRVHHAIIQSIYDCFVMAREDIDLARLEMCLATATGHWLDCWGEYFGVFRKSGETDDYYCKRIIKEVISPKCTIPAIKDYIVDFLNEKYDKDYTREDVIIKEPWKEIAKYSHKGALSHDARFFSGDYYCHAILDINIPEEVTSDLVDLVRAVKAAGVQVIWSIFNSYDIIGGFNNANDAWAAYHRWLQTETKRMQNTGFVLSYSGARLSGNPDDGVERPPHCISGSRQVWSMITSLYQWYAKVLDKDTDKSIIITKKDLIGVLDYYRIIEEKYGTELEKALKLSGDGTMSIDKSLSGSEKTPEEIETLVKIGDECLEALKFLDTFLTLSYNGRLSTEEGVMFNYTASHDLFGKLMEELERFKEQHRDYYNALQPPILNGERAMWLVTRNKNWLWNTPTMTHEDFFKLWEPYGEYEEHTINSITEFEDAYYKGYITFGDQYQPPVVVGDKFRWTPQMVQDWLYNSPAFHISDLTDVYRRQFSRINGQIDYPNFNIGEIEQVEEYNFEKYSVAKNAQPPIMVIPLPAPNPYDVVIGYNNTVQAYAIYSRNHRYAGMRTPMEKLTLSGTVDKAILSGRRQFFYEGINTEHLYSIQLKDRDADTSIILTRKDLMNILDFYTEIEKEIIGGNLVLSKDGTLSTDKMISGTGYTVIYHETPVELTQDMLDSLETLNRFVRLSQNGKMSTSQGTLSEYTVEHALFEKLIRELTRFKATQENYYNSVQAPILVKSTKPILEK